MGNVLSLLSCKKRYIHDVEKAEHAVEEHKETYTYVSWVELTPEAKAAKLQENSLPKEDTFSSDYFSSDSVAESITEVEDAKLPKKSHGSISELASVDQDNNVASKSANASWEELTPEAKAAKLQENLLPKEDTFSSDYGSISELASVDQDNNVASKSANLSSGSVAESTPEEKDAKLPKKSHGSISELASVNQGNNVASDSASEYVSTKSDKHSIGETNKKTIVRNFGILENDLDPLFFMDDLFERGCIERDRMDIYKSINPQNKRARRFLLDVICDPTDYTQTLFDVLKEKKHSYVLDELIHVKILRNGMPGCRHPTCCLTIIKTMITHSQSDMVPVDSGKIIIPLLEESLLPPLYFEDIAFKESIRKRNVNFIKYLENVKDNENDLITVFLDTLTTAGYDIFKLFMQHCYKHDGIPSDCQKKWKKQIWKQQEMQDNTMKDLQLRNGIQDNIEVDDTLYHSTGNEILIMKIIPQNISEQDSKAIVNNINSEKKEINASLSPQRIIEAQQGCIQITLAVSGENDINSTMKSINHLLEWGDVFYKIKNKHVIIKLYSIHIPRDTGEENETLSKYRIVRNFPFLIEEIDVLLFVKPFTEKNILSEEDFETKFKIGCSSRKLRTSFFLNYILKADTYCLKAFYEVLKSPNYKFIFDKLVENDQNMEFSEETNIKKHPCNKKNVSNQNDLKTSPWKNQPNVLGKTTKTSDNTKPLKSSQSKVFPAEAVSTKSDEQSIDSSISGLASEIQDNNVASESAYGSWSEDVFLDTDSKLLYGSISGLASVDQDNNVASESAYDTWSEDVFLHTGSKLLSEDVSTKSDEHSIAEAVSTRSDEQNIGETNKKTIVRNFGILENYLDPLLFIDDLYERGCIERDRMDIYKSINPQNKRARRFLLDVISNPTDYTQTLFDVLKEKKYKFVLDELIHEKIPRKGMPGCRHPTCCLTIIKTIITNSQSDMVPVDSGKVLIPLLEESLLLPIYFEGIAFENSIRKRNENFIKYLEKVKDNENDLIIVFLDTLTTLGYDVFQLFMKHCYKHDGIPSDCQEKWKKQIWKQQEMQGNTMKDLQLRNAIQDNIEVDDTLYHPTESLLRRSHGYIEPNNQTLTGKIFRSKSIDSNFCVVKNRYFSGFRRIGQKDSSSIWSTRPLIISAEAVSTKSDEQSIDGSISRLASVDQDNNVASEDVFTKSDEHSYVKSDQNMDISENTNIKEHPCNKTNIWSRNEPNVVGKTTKTSDNTKVFGVESVFRWK